VVNSLFTLGLIVGMTVTELTLGTTVANLGFESVTFPAPVFHGDTLRAVSEIVEARASASRPDAGVVVFEHRGLNQNDVLIASCRRAALMRRRPESTPAGAAYGRGSRRSPLLDSHERHVRRAQSGDDGGGGYRRRRITASARSG